MTLEALKPLIDQLEQNQQNATLSRAKSAYHMLENVDSMIEVYLKQKQTEQGAVLLDVFGLLQGLFVAIDALYDLAIGLTKYKYHININSNPILHELKFIRNDIVGHPTHRTYFNGGTGFSMLKHDGLSKEKLIYETYVYEKNKMKINEKIVVFKPLLNAYQNEKKQILSDIYQYITRHKTKTDIPEQLFELYETMNDDLLISIIRDFALAYHLSLDSNHRFFWRARLVQILIDWEVQEAYLNELIYYMTKYQISKLFEIALDMEGRKGKDLYSELPSVLLSFYKFMRVHESDALGLLESIHDLSDPLHNSNLTALMALNPPKEVSYLLLYLKELDDENKVYLIGSALKRYRPKKR